MAALIKLENVHKIYSLEGYIFCASLNQFQTTRQPSLLNNSQKFSRFNLSQLSTPAQEIRKLSYFCAEMKSLFHFMHWTTLDKVYKPPFLPALLWKKK